MIDASFVVAPKQRNTREENAKIKKGEGYELWNDNKHQKCHKDIDARWAKKRGENYYGYKNHIMAGKVSKLIDSYDVTDASVHDSQRSSSLVDEKCEGQHVWLDAGYVGTDAGFAQKGAIPVICEKGFRGHPLTDSQKKSNREKSKVRCRVEHIFGFMEQTMKGLIFRGVGIVRAKANIALTNLVYNMCRFAYLVKHPVKS